MLKYFLFIFWLLFSIEATFGQMKSIEMLKANEEETSIQKESKRAIFDIRSKKKCKKSFKKTEKMISKNNGLINCLKELERLNIYKQKMLIPIRFLKWVVTLMYFKVQCSIW